MTIDADPHEIVLPLQAEAAEVSKREVVTGRVRVSVETTSSDYRIEEHLDKHTVHVERVALGILTDTMPLPRQEGDTLIIPVVEEVITRQFRVTEEVRIKRTHSVELHSEMISLRHQTVSVTRESEQPTIADADILKSKKESINGQ